MTSSFRLVSIALLFAWLVSLAAGEYLVDTALDDRDREMLQLSRKSQAIRHNIAGAVMEPASLAANLDVKDFANRAREIARKRAIYVGTRNQLRMSPKMVGDTHTYYYTVIHPIEPLGADMRLQDKMATILLRYSAQTGRSSIVHVGTIRRDPRVVWDFKPLSYFLAHY
ncbi:uncharacterized protein PAN0_008d3427 [Moesziomyces antarcticus]|uniref:Uncharacterized protein n=2 Tax=Pseudozyma antarctica TaxID=84753 RepID=A0A081CEW4_PSEA2|nr:uncharacterized protein PAN0_008d3427 [Moesziomyces antarcticus]GAK65210.1 hypothetical protein PAN0_008d3427 [Moesziomyces antarcticus]SPO46210.1 uncharacterized protein PSANT_03896 [Moesziomyces antarcticus]